MIIIIISLGVTDMCDMIFSQKPLRILSPGT